MQKIKPCPICGNDRLLVYEDDFFGSVNCQKCGTKTEYALDYMNDEVNEELAKCAIERWNGRTNKLSKEQIYHCSRRAYRDASNTYPLNLVETAKYTETVSKYLRQDYFYKLFFYINFAEEIKGL